MSEQFLFEELKFFSKKFPEPQYLGAKNKLLPWIGNNIPNRNKLETVVDLFSGSQSVSYYFKQLGYKVISNDFLNFNNQIGKALIENSSETLDSNEIDYLFHPSNNKEAYSLIEDIYSNLFFTREDAVVIDNYRANVQDFDNEYKRALALAIMNRTLTRKVTMGHFGHTRALAYASDPVRIKRNRSLIRPIKEIFMDIVSDYNNAVFDNNKKNVSMCMNALDAIKVIQNADLIYLDPPYCNSHADYQGFYHLLETYTEYWKNKKFVNKIKRYEPQKRSGFCNKSEIIQSFEELFVHMEYIPYWMISYNNRSYPDIETMISLISKHRKVIVEQREYKNCQGGKGSVAGSSEILFICFP